MRRTSDFLSPAWRSDRRLSGGGRRSEEHCSESLSVCQVGRSNLLEGKRFGCCSSLVSRCVVGAGREALRGGFEPVKMLFSARATASDQNRGATGLRARLCLRLGCEKGANALDILVADL